MAAVLACGPGAVLSHRAAAELWRLLEPGYGDIDVTVLGQGGRAKRRGLRVHRSYLPRSATTVRDRLAVTTPTRTLTDLRRVGAPETYRRALRQAEFKNMDLAGLATDGTRSDPEADFLRLCRRHRLPPPEVNQRIGRYTVDFLWRGQRLVVEVDAWTTHRGSQAFEDDHQRDLDLRAQGFRVLRFTARQIRLDPKAVAAAVRTKLGA
jgi:very-short-patch-repair endonuclease